jgi:hypothetical protein
MISVVTRQVKDIILICILQAGIWNTIMPTYTKKTLAFHVHDMNVKSKSCNTQYFCLHVPATSQSKAFIIWILFTETQFSFVNKLTVSNLKLKKQNSHLSFNTSQYVYTHSQKIHHNLWLNSSVSISNFNINAAWNNNMTHKLGYQCNVLLHSLECKTRNFFPLT